MAKLRKLFVFVCASVVLLAWNHPSAYASTPLSHTVQNLLGVPYKWAGTSTKGFDCSGFTLYVFREFNIELPHTSRGQAHLGQKVSKSDLRPGDLLFFNTGGRGISHVGIYMGDGRFAHSSSSHGVMIDKLSEAYYAKRYVTARRVLGQEEFAKLASDLKPDI